MSEYPPSVQLCRLYEKTSKTTGNQYLVGRLGSAKIVVLKSKDTGDDGGPIWNVLVSEAPPKSSGDKATTKPKDTTAADEAAMLDHQRPTDPRPASTMPDDPMPI